MSPVRTAGKPTAPARFSAFSRRWFYGIIVFLVVVAAVVATALVVDARRSPHLAAADQVPEATPAVIAAPVEPAVDAATVESVLAGPAGDGALGTLTGEVTDAATGTSLWSRDQGTLLVPASSAKLTTATAALLTLPTDDRVATTVARGAEPGQIVLRGGGDITLQRTPGSGFFTDAASVSDLADQARTALAGDKVTSVIVDNSLREGDLFNSAWSTEDISAGNVAPLSAVMIDAGRIDPTQNYSPRSGTPAADVGHALAESLGVADAPVSVSDTPVEMTGDLATVYSATLGIRFRDMMLHSDNLLAESIGREVAAARDRPGTFDGATGAVLETLAEAGVDVSGAVLRDCSGMSADDRLSAKILDSVLALAAGSPMAGQATADDRAAELRLLFDSLPVSGVDGTLADRYLTGSGAEGAAGRVRAKTGTLDGVNTLAGTVTTDSGKVLTFAFLSNGSDMDAGRAALDRLAASLRKA